MDALFQNATGSPQKEMYHVDNGEHNDSWSIHPKSYCRKISDFIEKHKA